MFGDSGIGLKPYATQKILLHKIWVQPYPARITPQTHRGYGIYPAHPFSG